MEIIEYSKKFENDVKNLLVELQQYIVELDEYKLNILTPEYKNMYFKKTLNLISKHNGKIYLAIENERAIGMIAGYIAKYDKYDRIDYACPKKGIIEELIVTSSTRSNGVGNALICKIEEYFKENGCLFCQVDVFSPNLIAKNFYEKH